MREKYLYLPDAFEDPACPEPEDQAPDPLDRPDLTPPDAAAPTDAFVPFDPFGGAYEPCPCCGSDIPEKPSWGFICPVCLWEIDDEVSQDPLLPSDLNHGLCLDEARLNFHTFGISNPQLRWKEIEYD